jgi:hypothetical protein
VRCGLVGKVWVLVRGPRLFSHDGRWLLVADEEVLLHQALSNGPLLHSVTHYYSVTAALGYTDHNRVVWDGGWSLKR